MRSFWIALAATAVLATVPASAAQEVKREGQDPNKVICKRFADTGSMIKRRKQCMTAVQWDMVAASQQEGARKLVEDLRTRPAGE